MTVEHSQIKALSQEYIDKSREVQGQADFRLALEMAAKDVLEMRETEQAIHDDIVGSQ